MPGLFTTGDKIKTLHQEGIVGRRRMIVGRVLAEVQPGMYQIETDMGIAVIMPEADLQRA